MLKSDSFCVISKIFLNGKLILMFPNPNPFALPSRILSISRLVLMQTLYPQGHRFGLRHPLLSLRITLRVKDDGIQPIGIVSNLWWVMK